MSTRTPRSGRALFLKRVSAWGLTITMLCPPVTGLLTVVHAQAPVAPVDNPTQIGPAVPPPIPVSDPAYGADSILLFPFENNTKDAANDVLTGQVSDALKLRITTTGAYEVTTYSKFLAPVQRAVDDNVLASSDLTGPFDPQKAGRIATQVQTNDYLTGAVESYSADPTTRKVTIEVSADLRSTKTGNSIRSLAFTGTGLPFSNSDTMDVITQRAVNAVASKLASAIYPYRNRPIVVPSSERGHSKAGQTLLLALLTGALAYAILHNSSSGGGGGGSTSGGVGSGGSGSGGTSSGPGSPPSPPTTP